MNNHGDDSSDDEEFWMSYVESKSRSPKEFLERKNPFNELNDKKFKERFRLNKNTVLGILDEVKYGNSCGQIQKIGQGLEYTSDRNNSVPPINQLLLTLRFLATGTFQLVVGDVFGVDKSTACRIIHKVIPIIAELGKKYVKFPMALNDRKEVMGLFFKNTGFPGIIGAIDCTQIPIFSPGGEHAEAYQNRKGYFSINVQLVCDPELYIMDVVARWPGSSHDSTIFDFSSIRAKLEGSSGTDGYLIGDSGYPCRNYLLTPVPEPIRSVKEENYNKCHVQARNCIERANGVLKRRFPALKYGLRVKVEKVPQIVVAAVVLHNIARVAGDEDPPEDVELFNFIDEKRKAGHIVDFEIMELEPPPLQNNGCISQRSALIQSYF